MSVKLSDSEQNVDALTSVLSQPEVQASLVSALEKLPAMMEQYAVMERTIGLVSAVMNDKESMKYMVDGLKEDLPAVTIDKETLNAALVLLDKLPKLVSYVSLLEQLVDTAQAVLHDKDSVQYLFDGARGLVEPLVTKARDGLAIVDEAKERAKSDHSPVNVFTLTKLLKEPAAQKGVHFAKALLQVLESRSKDKA